MAKQKRKKTRQKGPVVRLRYIAAAVGCIAVLILAPLFTVWKQVYIRDKSLRKQVLTDSLNVCSREVARLEILVERLASTERIERIARDTLNMEYPSSERIVIVQPAQEPDRPSVFAQLRFMAILRRSFTQMRG